MTYQGPPSPKSGKTSVPSRPRGRWSDDDTDGDLPPWAGLGVKPRMAEPSQSRRSHRAQPAAGEDEDSPQRGSRRAQAVARAKRTRRTRYLLAAVLLVIVAAGVYEVPKLLAHPAPHSSLGLVTTFQAGESRTVPSACTAVTAATLSQYLPGTRHVVVPHSLDGRAQSMCDWTVDAPPVYRLLDVTVQAYSPSGLASGNGSATNAAVDAYQQAMQQKANPPKASHQPKAVITPVPGAGSAAFSALQVP